jgi:SAM-dependent methyltransferase
MSEAGFNRRNRDAWVAQVARSLPPGSRVLDVGAGPCRYRDLFEHCEYQTQDFCQYEKPETAPGKPWTYGDIDHVCDIAAIPVADASFDAILCTEVLEHVPHPLRALQEFARILKDGGLLFLTAPLGCGLHQEPYHYYGGFTPHFYRRFLPEVGFEVLSVDPNAGFFRHLIQEIDRAASFVRQHRLGSRWNPISWFLSRTFRRFLFSWLARLDDRKPIPDFSVGFHVVARKGLGPTNEPTAKGSVGS